jgi:hypothetical protein
MTPPLTNPSSSAAPFMDPLVEPRDHNLQGWTFDPALVRAGLILPAAGVLNVVRIKVVTDTVSNIVAYSTLGGVTLGTTLVGLYSNAGALLGQTASLAALFSSPGYKTCTLTAPVATTPNDWYQVAWFTSGLTLFSLACAASTAADSANAGLAGASLRFATADTGLTNALPATIGTKTASQTAWWVGVS